MRNLFRTAVYLILILAIILPCTISCQIAISRVKTPRIIHKNIPYRSFIFVQVSKVIRPVSCLGKSKLKGKLKECQELIKKLPTLTFNGVGSGSLVSYKNKKIILTAAHVCNMNPLKETKYKGHHIGLSTKKSIVVNFWAGQRFKIENFISDEKHDLCIMSAPEVDTLPKPIILSLNSPKLGDRVYNVAAPHGITGSHLSLIFEGRYSGRKNGLSYYTIPAKPGSSGSPVLNKNYQLVGIVNIAFVGIEHVSIGVSLRNIRFFLDKNISNLD